MEWNPVLEERLSQKRKAATWRWVGYLGVVVGIALGVIILFFRFIFGQFDEFGIGGLLVVPGTILILGLLVAIPAEKAGREARELQAQKDAI